MKKLIVFILLLPFGAFAQINYDSLKFEVIRATVNFYASDTTSFKFIKEKTCSCLSLEYNCILSFCSANQLTNVDSRVIDWKAMPVTGNTQLEQFIQIVQEKVLATKPKRKELQSYKLYTSHLLNLAEISKNSVQQASTQKTNEPPILIAKNIQQPVEVEKSNLNKLDMISLALSLLAIAFSIWQYWKNKKNSNIVSSTTEQSNVKKLEEKVDRLEEKLASLNGFINNKADIKEIQALSKKIDAIKETKGTELKKQKENSTEGLISNKMQTQSVTNLPVVLYAHAADENNGFSSKVLQQTQGELPYEIKMMGNEGTFVISELEEAQQFAMTDYAFILGSGCEFSNQPFPGCKIKTMKAGNIVKANFGLEITTKVLIKFI